MKIDLFVLLSLFAVATGAKGQPARLGSGLYRSAADFRGHRLMLGVNCKTETHKLRLHEFSGKPCVTVTHGGKD